MANLTFDFLHNYVTGERRASDPADAYQYDEGHVLEAVVPVAVTSCEIQYWIRGMGKADAYTPTSITQNTDNTYTILGNIPNSYFETNGDLRVYIVVTDGDASITTYEGYIHIKERQMPEDYVDDDPDNEAVRVIAEARAAAATATEKAGEAAESAEQAQEILDSIPEDYTELTEEVGNLKDDLNRCDESISTTLFVKVDADDLGITTKKFLNDNGLERDSASASYMVTDFIDVENTFKVRCIGKGSGPYCIHFYNAEQVSISRIATTAEVKYDVVADVPTNAKYLRLSTYLKSPEAYKSKPLNAITEELYYEIKDYQFVKDSVVYSDEYTGNTNLNISGGFIDTHGVLNTTSSISPSCYYSDFIPIKTDDMLFSGNCTVSVCGVHYYDENQNYISNEVTTSATKVTLSVPNNAAYLRLTSYNQPFTLWLPTSVKDKIEALGNGNNLHNKHVCVIGDSITEYNYRAKKNWSMLMAESTGCIIQNLGISGTGFARYNPYINRLNLINTDSDIIGIACSFNDLDAGIPLGTTADTGTATICGYINDFFTALISAFPITPIICYCQSPWASARLGNASSDSYINAVKEICEKNNIPFYGDMYYLGSALRPWIEANRVEYYTSDNDDLGNTGVVDSVHPNSKGHAVIEKRLVGYFEKNVK